MAINKTNGKKYVGFDSNWPSRKQNHLNQMRRTPGSVGYSRTKFHNALRKYGNESFDWVILEEYIPCDSTDLYCLRVLEPKHINEQDSYHSGYNSTLGGDGALGYKFTEEQKINLKNVMIERGYPMTGKSHSEKTKNILREKNLGKVLSNEHKEKCVHSLLNYMRNCTSEDFKQRSLNGASKRKGRTRSEETKQKIREANTNPSEETRQKMSDSHKGKVLTDFQKKKISNSLKGREFSKETREKISESKKGINKTEEEKKKIKDSLKNLYENGYINPQSKPITIDGVLYNSIKEASEKTGLSRWKIKNKYIITLE